LCSWCTLDIDSLPDTWFSHIFSHSGISIHCCFLCRCI
jgi:hypothetical protein